MLSSLQTAIRHLDPTCDGVLVVLADQPMVTTETIDKLLAEFVAGRQTLLAPAYHGRRGNPVLIDRHFFPELLALPWGKAPRDLLRRHPDALRLVEVGTDSILRDLDRPQDYRQQRPAPPFREKEE
jgi:molybdenum cofactor cytidylyltransferase